MVLLVNRQFNPSLPQNCGEWKVPGTAVHNVAFSCNDRVFGISVEDPAEFAEHHNPGLGRMHMTSVARVVCYLLGVSADEVAARSIRTHGLLGEVKEGLKTVQKPPAA